MKRIRTYIPYYLVFVVLITLFVLSGVQSTAALQTMPVLMPGMITTPVAPHPAPTGVVLCPWDPEGG